MSPESDNEKGYNDTPVKFLTLQSGLMGVLASMGGFIFGYDTGKMFNVSSYNGFGNCFTNAVFRSNIRVSRDVRLSPSLFGRRQSI